MSPPVFRVSPCFSGGTKGGRSPFFAEAGVSPSRNARRLETATSFLEIIPAVTLQSTPPSVISLLTYSLHIITF